MRQVLLPHRLLVLQPTMMPPLPPSLVLLHSMLLLPMPLLIAL